MLLHNGNDTNIHQVDQPGSFVALMGEHFADPSVSNLLKLEEYDSIIPVVTHLSRPPQYIFQHGCPSKELAQQALEKPLQVYQQVPAPNVSYSQQEVEYMHTQFKLNSRIQELE